MTLAWAGLFTRGGETWTRDMKYYYRGWNLHRANIIRDRVDIKFGSWWIVSGAIIIITDQRGTDIYRVHGSAVSALLHFYTQRGLQCLLLDQAVFPFSRIVTVVEVIKFRGLLLCNQLLSPGFWQLCSSVPGIAHNLPRGSPGSTTFSDFFSEFAWVQANVSPQHTWARAGCH